MIPSTVFFPVEALQTEFSLSSRFFEKSWEYAKDVCASFGDREKTYGRVLGSAADVRDARLLQAVMSLFSCSDVCVSGVKS